MKFDEIISKKLEQLDEQPTSAGTVQAPTNVAGTAQTQPQVTTQTPEQQLISVFQQLPFQADPQKAVATFNTALKNAGQVPGVSQFFTNLGYDGKRGFVYIDPNLLAGQVAKPEVGQRQATTSTPGAAAPGATATTVQGGTSVGSVNP